jgi:excinuclease ABC subunit C
LGSKLDEIKGIGPKSRSILLNHFKSLDNILNATFEEIEEVIGPKRTKILIDQLKKRG